MTYNSYFYFTRKGAGGSLSFGITGEEGAPVDSGLTVTIKGEGFDDTLAFNETDDLPLADEYLIAFANGVAYELGASNPLYNSDFKAAARKLRGHVVANKYPFPVVRPMNLRGDAFTTYRGSDAI